MGVEVVLPHAGYENVRRWPRYKMDVPVRVILQPPRKPTIVQGRGTQLNRGGMAVFAGVELAVEDEIAVEFTVPYSGQPIRVRGHIRDRKGYTYGLEFITQDEGEYRNVAQLEAALRALGTPM